MTRWFRELRLLPIVLAAVLALFALKSFGLLFDGGYILSRSDPNDATEITAAEADPVVVGSVEKASPEQTPGPPIPRPTMAAGAANRLSWAQEMFNFPETTGSIGGGKDDAKPAAQQGAKGVPKGAAADNKLAVRPRDVVPDRPDVRNLSAAERAILERLQDRRRDIEARARELDMRESLIKAAEKRLETRIQELKAVQGRIKLADTKKDELEAARLKSLVSMYESMKAKDAARIFDRLNLKILIEVASQINPRRMADILAQMSPEAAEKLTIEFASRATGRDPPPPTELPKIEGRPIPGEPPG